LEIDKRQEGRKMSVGAIPYHTFPSVGYAISEARNGKMSLPVSQSAYIYSHFRHVNGVPAPEGTQGVNLTKLKILDTMIEQLDTVKRQLSRSELSGEISDARMNALVEKLQKQIQTSAAAPYPASVPAGVLFNITA
jgi:hypothetical protein